MKGRKPKPSRLRVLQGIAGHRPLPVNEPKPEPGIPPCPEHLSAAAKEEWAYAVAELDGLGLLTRADKAVLAGYCQSFAAWAECERFLAENGNVIVMRNDKGEIKWTPEAPQARLALKYMDKIRQFAAELGLSASARTRIQAEPVEKQSPTEDFL